jgi:hypothetical protein
VYYPGEYRDLGRCQRAHFETIEAAADFWDTHDLSDYWDQTSAVDFDVELGRRVILVPLEQNIARQLANVARKQGLSTFGCISPA